jgi:hypothetical protein
MPRALFALTLLLLLPAVAHAKCAPSADPGTSANKKWKAVPKLDGTFAFLAWDDSKKDFAKKHEGKIELPGHHVKTFVADSGEQFVLFDEYEGLSIHRADGELVTRLKPEDLLTKEEAERPHTWACHPEGEWSNKKVELEGQVLKVGSHKGRTIELELATGRGWVEKGSCTIPGMVKAHGLMNCIAEKWTCKRCKKGQDGLQWRICEGCCKELDVCHVCNKKIEKPEKTEKK